MAMPTAYERILKLLDSAPADPDLSGGYLNLLQTTPEPSLAQSVMQSTFLPKIYERVWRPVGFNLAKGWPFGPSTAEEFALARERLGLRRTGDGDGPAATVLDVACGPGNVTRGLAAGVGEGGLTVGIDMSPTMLARAVADTALPGVGYVRGDAMHLPFREGSFDAVCCFGGLYLFSDPWAALDSMTRVLKPGGRIALLTSRRPRLPLSRRAGDLAARAGGMTMFGDTEVTGGLGARGYEDVRRRSYPLMQFVSARLG
ncbi:class I SAM-dependent methyltransferase [Actinomadura scrupuli]|uniref:class I SAM-dependent methyltransferase n=1 Tax=Actinomadura scrupuli TaxID=559629 RepID=UPI003D980F77